MPKLIAYFSVITRLMWTNRKTTLIFGAVGTIFVLLMVLLIRLYSAESAKNLIYTVETAPEYPVAIVFGAWVDPGGSPSAVLEDRIKVGANLYKAGKVKVLLLTGDNHIATYNEPEAMRQYALTLGIPDAALVLDYAGFRTYDSCYRAHDIFKVKEAILVTQAYHLDRALLTCNTLGIATVGVAADAVRPAGYAQWNLLLSELREIPSTAFAVIDLIGGRKPTFLGEPLPIFANR